MSLRDQWEPILKDIAGRLPDDEIYSAKKGTVAIHVYYCHDVMAIASQLRKFTRASDAQAQHDTLKILFKHAKFGAVGEFEVHQGPWRLDIYVAESHLIVQVRTIVKVTVDKLREKPIAAFEQDICDQLWIAFFYKFKGDASPNPACKYLLEWIDINSASVTSISRLNKQLTAMVQKSKQAIAKKLDVSDEIIIPVDNILLAEELEREVRELKNKIAEKDEIIDNQANTIAELKKRLGMD
ncbi:MAG TPA: hypothetical protein VKM55_08710 [Candidatus Lokiarchaeia archaeon]|nr:hypothetical protein [Candidatus Lokiarchaeia archaeon]